MCGAVVSLLCALVFYGVRLCVLVCVCRFEGVPVRVALFACVVGHSVGSFCGALATVGPTVELSTCVPLDTCAPWCIL